MVHREITFVPRGVRHEDNPFFQIRTEAGLLMKDLPGVHRSTSSALEHGVRQLTSQATLMVYHSLTDLFDSPMQILQEYQRLYGYPETDVQGHAGQRRRDLGHCEYCDRDGQPLVRHSQFFDRPICAACYPNEYMKLDHVQAIKLASQRRMMGVIGECQVCRKRGGRVQCVMCDAVLCRHCRVDSGVIDETTGQRIYWCRECAEL